MGLASAPFSVTTLVGKNRHLIEVLLIRLIGSDSRLRGLRYDQSVRSILESRNSEFGWRTSAVGDFLPSPAKLFKKSIEEVDIQQLFPVLPIPLNLVRTSQIGSCLA